MAVLFKVSFAREGFDGECATDENIRTWWAAQTGSREEYLLIDLEAVQNVAAIQVNFADHQLSVPYITDEDMVVEMSNTSMRYIMAEARKITYLLEASTDGKEWETVKDNRTAETDVAHDLIVLSGEKEIRFLRISQMGMPFAGVPAISGLRVFGKGKGPAPTAVKLLDAERVENDMTVNLTWKSADGEKGYNVRYGIASDKLYSSWQVTENKNRLRLSMLNSGIKYYIAVDSYNENGITKGAVHCIA